MHIEFQNVLIYLQKESLLTTMLSGFIGSILGAFANYFAIYKTSDLDRKARKNEVFYKTIFNDFYELLNCYVNLVSKCNYENYNKEDLIEIKELIQNYIEFRSDFNKFQLIVHKWNNKFSVEEKTLLDKITEIFDRVENYLFIGTSEAKPIEIIEINNEKIKFKKVDVLKEQCLISKNDINKLNNYYKNFINKLIDNLEIDEKGKL